MLEEHAPLLPPPTRARGFAPSVASAGAAACLAGSTYQADCLGIVTRGWRCRRLEWQIA